YKLHLSRGTVMHHINKLMEAGIVISQRGKYILRVGNLEAVVEELQKDINRTCEDLKQIAKEIDEGIGL
ncbi:ArsR family transcriptional regulator, partial [Candidatus Woesearchaeota archaeon]|nr:ArsR family transcriptional regulator [Candidatus Woesearchaeota archaeon]